MRILFLGVDKGTSKHRMEAMRRLGHTVSSIDPQACLPNNYIKRKFHYETGAIFYERTVTDFVLGAIGEDRFDCCWTDGGFCVGPTLIANIHRQGCPVINYNVDDPFGTRDRFHWELYKKSVPHYDILVVVRPQNVPEAYQRGAQKVLHVFRSADEVAHSPRNISQMDFEYWQSDVVCVATWMPERGPFLSQLMNLGVPLSIYGDRWNRAREWKLLQPAWRGPATAGDDEYAKAVQCAKVCLGLLSKGNRDLHTQRSLEIPSLGSLFCAERTTEHQTLYREGEEAIFWSDAAECAEKCLSLLSDDPARSSIAKRGHERCMANNLFNESIISYIFSHLF
jgi:spore maturation protein CgeB